MGDVSSVKKMYRMFDGATEFNGDVSDWDVSTVKDMYYMFGNATVFNSDVSDWDVSSVKDMTGMFYGATKFNQQMCWLMLVEEGDVFDGNLCSPCIECTD